MRFNERISLSFVNPEGHETISERYETNFERTLKKYSLIQKDEKFLRIGRVHKVMNSNYFHQQTKETHNETNGSSKSHKFDKEGRKQGWRK